MWSIIDQHAAHERVLYEKTLRGMETREYTSQYLSPPLVLNLSMQEANVLKENLNIFTNIGFEIEAFGGDSYAVRAVPDNLFSIAKKDLFIEMLDEMAEGIESRVAPDMIAEKVASMSCKAAVKGNSRLSGRSGSVNRRVVRIRKSISLSTRKTDYHCNDKKRIRKEI